MARRRARGTVAEVCGRAYIAGWFQGVPVSEIVFVVEEAQEGGLVARALGASIVTEADDLAQLRQQVRDAVRCHFDEGRLPKVIRLHYVREEVFAA